MWGSIEISFCVVYAIVRFWHAPEAEAPCAAQPVRAVDLRHAVGTDPELPMGFLPVMNEQLQIEWGRIRRHVLRSK